ncbi:MAG: OmpA family protein [Bacteroidota bacterium]
MKHIITTLTLLFFLHSSFAQNIEFKSSNFKGNKEGLKAAEENIKKADELLEKGEAALVLHQETPKLFADALALYLKANEFNPNNAELNIKLGKCYLQTWKKRSAIPLLEKALKLDPQITPEVYIYLAQAYTFENKFKESKAQIDLFKTKAKEKDVEKNKETINKIYAQCDTAIKLVVHPEKVSIQNIKEINTPYPDFCASISADESMLLFNSIRPGTMGGKMGDDGFNNSDVFVSHKLKGKWTSPVAMGAPINTDGEDICVGLSPDGQTMLLSKNTTGNYDLYFSKLQGDTWGELEKMQDGKINSPYNETHASINYNGTIVYYVSDNPYGNRGGKDLFFSGLANPRINLWGKGQTVTSDINSKYNENSIFIHPDDNTIYFSSQGFNSIGGYDIFVTKRVPGGWTKPVNMGYPINTPYDETYFVMSANGRYGYLTSNREENGVGEEDIYRVKFLGSLKPAILDNEDHLLASFALPVPESNLEGAVDIDAKNLTILKGRVLDAFTMQPISAEIEITDNVKNESKGIFTSNSSTGKFLVSMPSGINYGLNVKAKDYLFFSENFDLPKLSDYSMVEKDILLTGMCIGCKIVLRNIFFDSGKSTLRPESTNELSRLVQLINDISKVKPNVKIEISGHTDNVGSESTNQVLSESRAKAVVTYLITQGISASKLTFKGYGSTVPFTKNDSPANRQLNRRTEFKIVE